jgi:hypothetical protein
MSAISTILSFKLPPAQITSPAALSPISNLYFMALAEGIMAPDIRKNNRFLVKINHLWIMAGFQWPHAFVL